MMNIASYLLFSERPINPLEISLNLNTSVLRSMKISSFIVPLKDLLSSDWLKGTQHI